MPAAAVPEPPSLTRTDVASVDAGLSVSVNVISALPVSPSVTLADEMETDGRSSSVIVRTPDAPPSRIEAFDALLSPTVTSSFPSWTLSPITVTETFFEVCPSVKVSVPPVIAS